ncbi:MAG TPA: M42 family metallopeptidase [Petrotogaceae bacterium]|jgi:putative aminopeptidase FrvX|nr:M42 family metallopeptidase [Petrotogaceae bacterium]HQH32980.1 M42 family metallopeptidase [Petrotogaceae bacterium]HQI79482.1 M42 family metallopeptidase [Petrotogaceae bacterium]
MDKLCKQNIDRAVANIVELCKIPSPSGFTNDIRRYLTEKFESMGFKIQKTNKGSVLVCLGGEQEPLLLAAHVDTLGAMVRSIKSNGRLRITKIGGYPENLIETENCIVHTRDGKKFEGTFQIEHPSVHVYSDAASMKRDDTTMEVVLDEKVFSKDDTVDLGISAGDFISLDSRTRVTSQGFIKSRHLDDKASAGILMELAEMVRSGQLVLNRKTYLLFTMYEEVGHGGASGIPQDVKEMISVDMGAVGDDLGTDEYKVSICAKDSGGPYDYDVTSDLVRTAKENNLNYSVDIYPRYGSDVEAALSAGYDIKHGLIGPGVYASHGYERTHLEGIENTLLLIVNYIKKH